MDGRLGCRDKGRVGAVQRNSQPQGLCLSLCLCPFARDKNVASAKAKLLPGPAVSMLVVMLKEVI